MQDLKRQSNRRPVVRKFRSSRMTIRKNRSNPIPGISLKLRKTNSEPGFINHWLPTYFIENEPSYLRNRFRVLIQKFIETLCFIFVLWLAGGSFWIGQNQFNSPVKKIIINGNTLVSKIDVLKTSGIRQGQLLFDLIPFQIAERLQKHPAIKTADIRIKFPNEIHLILTEHKPIALLKVSNNHNSIKQFYSEKDYYFLIGKDQRILKKLSFYELRNSFYNKLPIISGLDKKSLKIGSQLNSTVVERGFVFLAKYKKIIQKSEESESKNIYENQSKIVELQSKQIHIDISDPLNLKINWSGQINELKKDSQINSHKLAPSIQMGSRYFAKRLHTLRNILAVIDEKHPRLSSIDLRYKNKVMLLP